jgi:hypothetical protein
MFTMWKRVLVFLDKVLMVPWLTVGGGVDRQQRARFSLNLLIQLLTAVAQAIEMFQNQKLSNTNNDDMKLRG